MRRILLKKTEIFESFASLRLKSGFLCFLLANKTLQFKGSSDTAAVPARTSSIQHFSATI
jgi:hypothetical protein